MLSINTSEFGPVRAAWAFTLEGELQQLTGKQEGDLFAFRLPATEMASIVLVNRLAPLVQWSADTTLAAGEGGVFRLLLTNLNPEPTAASVILRPPRGWAVYSQSVPPIPSGKTVEVRLPVTVPKSIKTGRYDLWAEVSSAAGKFSAYAMIAVAEPVIAEFRGNPGRYYLLIENLTGQAVKGTVGVAAPAPLHVSAPGSFALPPRGKIEVPVNVEGQDKLSQIAEMNARVTTPVATWNLVRAAMPTVPNGDFEMDGAGDMRPDWWMCRKLRDEWDPESMRLETGAPSGKYCLRLDPSTDPAGFTRAYSVNGAVKPNTKYRISAWIKRGDPQGEVYIAFSGFGWQRLQTAEVDRWVHLQMEVTSSETGGEMTVNCYNSSRQPAWFDGISIEEAK